MIKLITEEITTFIAKWGYYILYIFIGIVGKFAYDIVQKKKMSFLQALGSVGVAGVTGYFACIWCMQNSPEKAPYLVPLATLLSEKFFNWIFSLNWKTLFETFFKIK